jgi:radical SAM-linked protein
MIENRGDRAPGSSIFNLKSPIFNPGGSLDPMTGDKLRFRFAKAGTLRLLSHHDLMRCLERMLRRAGVPFKSTAGFHPTPRLVFALSLPLGVLGREEVVELELTRPCDPADVLARLNAQAPEGLSFTRVSVVPMRATAIPRRVGYTLPLPEDRSAETAGRATELMRAEKVWVDRLRPSPKRLNIRPYLRRVIVASGGRGSYSPGLAPGPGPAPGASPGLYENQLGIHAPARLELDLWVTQTGTARADELVKLLGLADLLDAGAVLERTTVEVRDEVPESPDPADNPPDGPAESQPLDPAAAAALARGEDEQDQPAGAQWGASPAGPVVE